MNGEYVMPRYDYECDKCGEFELVHSMHETVKLCPCCGALIKKVIRMPQVIARDNKDWRDENNGRGRYIPQVAKRKGDPSAYFRTQKELVDSAKRQGYVVTKGEEP